eukprot:CAMPEP_0174929036 /NCGR_PEP_ID=MMETSP1355-20121228/26984_1 /TAXON_ID=464990 /ORGANISM="Hemiselmis tepida, Strain CCMP443" /LENGTH=1151 /DNA_ID=CAMNT_0016175219 /DNA_START=14 /DNA_END=3469 /DNA_ORIENTATION=+
MSDGEESGAKEGKKRPWGEGLMRPNSFGVTPWEGQQPAECGCITERRADDGIAPQLVGAQCKQHKGRDCPLVQIPPIVLEETAEGTCRKIVGYSNLLDTNSNATTLITPFTEPTSEQLPQTSDEEIRGVLGRFLQGEDDGDWDACSIGGQDFTGSGSPAGYNGLSREEVKRVLERGPGQGAGAGRWKAQMIESPADGDSLLDKSDHYWPGDTQVPTKVVKTFELYSLGTTLQHVREPGSPGMELPKVILPEGCRDEAAAHNPRQVVSLFMFTNTADSIQGADVSTKGSAVGPFTVVVGQTLSQVEPDRFFLVYLHPRNNWRPDGPCCRQSGLDMVVSSITSPAQAWPDGPYARKLLPPRLQNLNLLEPLQLQTRPDICPINLDILSRLAERTKKQDLALRNALKSACLHPDITFNGPDWLLPGTGSIVVPPHVLGLSEGSGTAQPYTALDLMVAVLDENKEETGEVRYWNMNPCPKCGVTTMVHLDKTNATCPFSGNFDGDTKATVTQYSEAYNPTNILENMVHSLQTNTDLAELQEKVAQVERKRVQVCNSICKYMGNLKMMYLVNQRKDVGNHTQNKPVDNPAAKETKDAFTKLSMLARSWESQPDPTTLNHRVSGKFTRKHGYGLQPKSQHASAKSEEAKSDPTAPWTHFFPPKAQKSKKRKATGLPFLQQPAKPPSSGKGASSAGSVVLARPAVDPPTGGATGGAQDQNVIISKWDMLFVTQGQIHDTAVALGCHNKPNKKPQMELLTKHWTAPPAVSPPSTTGLGVALVLPASSGPRANHNALPQGTLLTLSANNVGQSANDCNAGTCSIIVDDQTDPVLTGLICPVSISEEGGKVVLAKQLDEQMTKTIPPLAQVEQNLTLFATAAGARIQQHGAGVMINRTDLDKTDGQTPRLTQALDGGKLVVTYLPPTVQAEVITVVILHPLKNTKKVGISWIGWPFKGKNALTQQSFFETKAPGQSQVTDGSETPNFAFSDFASNANISSHLQPIVEVVTQQEFEPFFWPPVQGCNQGRLQLTEASPSQAHTSLPRSTLSGLKHPIALALCTVQLSVGVGHALANGQPPPWETLKNGHSIMTCKSAWDPEGWLTAAWAHWADADPKTVAALTLHSFKTLRHSQDERSDQQGWTPAVSAKLTALELEEAQTS